MKEILLADKEMVFLVILYFNGIYYLSVKIWYCSLWFEILVDLGIYFWVRPDFCDGNCGELLVTFLG